MFHKMKIETVIILFEKGWALLSPPPLLKPPFKINFKCMNFKRIKLTSALVFRVVLPETVRQKARRVLLDRDIHNFKTKFSFS